MRLHSDYKRTPANVCSMHNREAYMQHTISYTVYTICTTYMHTRTQVPLYSHSSLLGAFWSWYFANKFFFCILGARPHEMRDKVCVWGICVKSMRMFCVCVWIHVLSSAITEKRVVVSGILYTIYIGLPTLSLYTRPHSDELIRMNEAQRFSV